MLFPKLNKNREKSVVLSRFSSLVTKGNVPDGGFRASENLSSSLAPFISTRPRRGIYSAAAPLDFGGQKITAALSCPAGVLICTETDIFLAGVKIFSSLDSSVTVRTAVPFGRNVFIVPDGIYVECTDSGVTVSDCSFDFTAVNCELSFALSDGTEIFPSFAGEFPQSASAGDLAVISSASGGECWQYTGQSWKYLYDVYMKLFFTNKISGVSKGMSLYAEGDGSLFDNGYFTVMSCTENSLVLSGAFRSQGSCPQVRLSKSVPLMDFAVEHNNRVYGCRYGKNRQGSMVNEIYISKAGDPREWYSLQGISTDSYSAGLGCSGEFTGAGKLGGEIIFFKEDYAVRILGSMPADFTVYSLPLSGVQRGHHLSLCSHAGSLIYKSREGILMYDGNTLTSLSPSLDLSSAVSSSAGISQGKYYLAVTDADTSHEIYTLDLKNGIWHRESDCFGTTFMLTKSGNLFLLGKSGKASGYTLFTPDFSAITPDNRAIPIYGEVAFTPAAEENISFSFETGRLFEDITSYNKKIRCIRISLKTKEESSIRLFIKTDSQGEYKSIFFLDKKTDGIFCAAVPTAPCRYFSLMAEGSGDTEIYAIECVINNCSEVTDID